MKPLVLEWTAADVGGRPGHRLMTVLRAPGCAWAEKSRCTMCAFPTEFGTGPVSADEIVAQVDAALADLPEGDGPIRVELFVSGSWLNAGEIPAEGQVAALRRLARLPRVQEILVETRPEYVHPGNVAELVAAAGRARLEIGIGLETVDDRIRVREIRKGFTLEAFGAAARDIAAAGAGLLVYVLLKPPGTSEAESIADAVATARHAFGLGHELGLPVRVALEPCFVAAGTALELDLRAGRYRPPWLWSAVEVVRRVGGLGALQVGLSDEGMKSERASANCPACTPRVKGALAEFNRTRDVAVLDGLDCVCRARWRAEVAETSR